MATSVLPCGERAILVELESLHDVLDLHEALSRHAHADVLVDAVPGARTLLLVAASADLVPRVQRLVAEVLAEVVAASQSDGGRPRAQVGPTGEVTLIEVRYDGPDLDAVATATGLTTDEVVRAHTGQDWTVGFAGFAPGFAYLVDGDPRLRVARRSSPRTRVPPGAVGLAGEFSGIYPRPSPGGWQLIGSTDAPLWDPDRRPPALLVPGNRVRFVDVPGAP